MVQSGQGQEQPRKGIVPDIVGETTANADGQITSANFDVGTRTATNAPSGNPGVVGTVVTQVQTAGDLQILANPVDYTYYSPHFPPYFPPTTFPQRSRLPNSLLNQRSSNTWRRSWAC